MSKRDNRKCSICSKPLVRRSFESDSRYAKRKTCANEDLTRTECSKSVTRVAMGKVAKQDASRQGDKKCEICGAVIQRRPNETNCDYMRKITCRGAIGEITDCAKQHIKNRAKAHREAKARGEDPPVPVNKYSRANERAKYVGVKKEVNIPAPVRREVSLTQLLAWKTGQEAIEIESRAAYQRQVNTPIHVHYRHSLVLSYLFT